MIVNDTPHFAAFDSVDAQDIADFAVLNGPLQQVRRGSNLRMQGEPSPEVYLLRTGWLVCHLSTKNAGRQIVKIHMPGDLVGMPSLACSEGIETIQALTNAEVSRIPLEAFATVFRDHPRLAAMLFLWAQEERVSLMKRVASIGRTQSIRRVATLIIGLHSRIFFAQETRELTFPAPLTQQDIADATGMSVVQTNRSLRALRTRNLVTWHDGVVEILDFEKLSALADFPAEHRRSTKWLRNI